MLVKLISHPAVCGLPVSLHAAYHRYACLPEDVPEENLADFLAHGNFDAACIAPPFQKQVASLCACLDEAATMSGSVDAVIREKDRLVGYNTSYSAFLDAAYRAGISLGSCHALLLGESAPSPAIRLALQHAGATSVLSVSSIGELLPTLPGLADVTLLINTLPPQEAVHVDLSLFPALRTLWDTVCLPLRSPLRQAAEARGIRTVGGARFLAAQTEMASAHFTDRRPDPACISFLSRRVAEEGFNIVLSGMPGSGKRTVGQRIAKLLGKRFLCVEDCLTEELGVPPAAYAAANGIPALREAETELLTRIGAEPGLVIATRAETALWEENRVPLRQNGLIFLLLRDPDLSAIPDAACLWRERLPRYAAFCDRSVENKTTVRDCARLIAEEALRDCETIL